MLRCNFAVTVAACSLIALLADLPAAAQNPPTMFPPVRGTHEMVAAANNLEVEAGFRMLTEGGNAIDAGVATALTATVTEQSRVGLRAAITPGLVDGLLLALEKYGTMSFSQVVQPAIESADGFPIGDEFSQFLGELVRIFPYFPESFKFFYPTGKTPHRGDLVKMPNLAKTLREMAMAEQNAKGDRVAKLHAVHDYFYKGPIAHRIADFSQANGGLLAYDDLANYHAEQDEPRSTTYRGYTIYKTGFWAQGPV